MRSFVRIMSWGLLGLLVLAVLLHLLLVATGTTYLYKAAVYQEPGIDDLALFPYRTVSFAPQAQPWEKARNYNQTELTPALQSALEKHRSVAFVVIKDNQLMHSQYWDGYSADKNSNSFSVAKSIVSALIGIAIREGHIASVNDRVAEYLPSFAKGDKNIITIRDVLRMASGLDFDEAYNQPVSDTTEAYYGDDLNALVDGLEVSHKPGSLYRYKSGDTQVLAMILTAATRETVASYASKKLWSKIGAEHSAQWSLDQQSLTDTGVGIEKAYCCFYSNALDFARFGQLYLNKGRNQSGEQIVPEAFVENSVAANALPDDAGGTATYYGYQWWRYDLPVKQPDGSAKIEDVFYARGILGQYIFIMPEHQMVVVRLGHERGEKVNNHPTEVPVLVKESIKLWGNTN